jgi:DNA end-binding protein Ku
MPRPVWSGTISFGLVSIPVKMFNAVSRKSVTFNQLDDRTNARIKYKKVSADTGDEVPEDHIVKGYEVAKGQYVIVDPDELEQFMPSATKALELDDFVPLSEIDPMLFDNAFYLAPDKVAKPYAVLAQAMEKAGKVGVGRLVMRNKQYVAAIRSVDGHLVMSTMVYPDEVVRPASIDEMESLESVEVNDRELAMAEQLVESLAGEFDHTKYSDSYRHQVLELIERKAAGETLESVERPAPAAQVVDLMAALEASVKAAKEARSRHPAMEVDAGSKTDAGDAADAAEVKPAKAARVRKSA